MKFLNAELGELVGDVCSIAERSVSPKSRQTTSAADKLVFFVVDPPKWGYELWRTDGTREGTFAVETFDNSPPGNLTAMGGRLYFSSDSARGKKHSK